MKLTIDAFRAVLQSRPAPPRFWIAYSGGLDSHVLLHLCARLERVSRVPALTAVHVHHGLQANADAWAVHCKQTCQDLNIPFLLIKVDASARPGESPEEAARNARYRAILSQLAPGEIVLTAQHRDDQAETLLLQLMRGAGLAGLAAMPECSELGPGLLMRPLLSYSRQELQAYAEQFNLRWVDDPSNLSMDHDRNYLRHRIIPLLAHRWPGVKKALSRTANHCAEAQRLLGDWSADLCQSALRADGESLDAERLKSLRRADQRLVLREWLRHSGYRMPPAVTIERILREVLPAARDKTPVVSWGEGEVRCYRNGIFLLPPQTPVDAGLTITWNGKCVLTLPDGNGKLTATMIEGRGIAPEAWQTGAITVRYRKGGESCRLPRRMGTRELKKLFQEAGIPPWLRARAPLVYINDELAAVADWWVCEPFAVTARECGMAIAWHRSN